MDSALIISYSGKSADCLAGILKEASVTNIATVSSAGEAKRQLMEKDFDLCVINTPLPDEFGENIARQITARKLSVVISKPLLWNALKLTSVMHRRINAIKNENRKLIQKIEDIRIIDRAKCILISHLSLTEPEAHRYIEKQAMDMRMTRRKVAEEILKTYEN